MAGKYPQMTMLQFRYSDSYQQWMQHLSDNSKSRFYNKRHEVQFFNRRLISVVFHIRVDKKVEEKRIEFLCFDARDVFRYWTKGVVEKRRQDRHIRGVVVVHVTSKLSTVLQIQWALCFMGMESWRKEEGMTVQVASNRKKKRFWK